MYVNNDLNVNNELIFKKLKKFYWLKTPNYAKNYVNYSKMMVKLY